MRLLRSRPDPNTLNREGRMALMGAALMGRNDVGRCCRSGRQTRHARRRQPHTDTNVSAIPAIRGRLLDYADGPCAPRPVGGPVAGDAALPQDDDRPRSARAAQPYRRIDLRRRLCQNVSGKTNR
jgi:hypothetical protein